MIARQLLHTLFLGLVILGQEPGAIGAKRNPELGIVHPLDPMLNDAHGRRVARWKTEHVTYHRLLDLLDR